jgi:hypothetical protein
LCQGGRALIKGSQVANSAAGRNSRNLVDDAASAGSGINKAQNMRNAAFSSKTDDVAQSTSCTFTSREKAWKDPFGQMHVRNGLKGEARTGPPLHEESDWLVFRLLGINKISFPKTNYGIAKNLSGAEFAAITRHEKTHIWFFNAFPRTTLWASSRIGTPGKGISRFLIELHGNMAEHNGHIGKAFLGAIGKDTPWEVLAKLR